MPPEDKKNSKPQDSAAPAEKGFVERVADNAKELSTDVQKALVGYYKYAEDFVKSSPTGQKMLSQAEFFKEKGIHLGEDGLKKAEKFWDDNAPQGLKDAAHDTGNFMTKNGFGLGAGLLGLLGGLMMGLGPIEAILIGVLGFALGGSFGDGKDGLMGSLGKMLGFGGDDKKADAPGHQQNVSPGDPSRKPEDIQKAAEHYMMQDPKKSTDGAPALDANFGFDGGYAFPAAPQYVAAPPREESPKLAGK